MQRQQEQDNHDAVDNLVMLSSSGNNVNNNQSIPMLTRQGRWWEKWITPEIQQQTQQNNQQQNKDIMNDRDSRIEDLEGPEEEA